MDTPASRRDFYQQAGTADGHGRAGTDNTGGPRGRRDAGVAGGGSAIGTPRGLRALLRRPGLLVAPEAYTVIAGKLAEVRGFEVIYIGGNMMSMTYLGVPDWGVITPAEMVEIGGRIAREVAIPAIVDADQAAPRSTSTARCSSTNGRGSPPSTSRTAATPRRWRGPAIAFRQRPVEVRSTGPGVAPGPGRTLV